MKSFAFVNKAVNIVFAAFMLCTGCGASVSQVIGNDAGPGSADAGGGACIAEAGDCSGAQCCQGLVCGTSGKCIPRVKRAAGEQCTGDSDCSSGLCYNGGGSFASAYCSKSCKTDTECVFESGAACCNGGTCEKIGGAYCGSRTGDLGRPCSAGGSSDCLPGMFCTGERNADGTFHEGAVCSRICAQDGECVFPLDPATWCLVCAGPEGQQKSCIVDPLCTGRCSSDGQCSGGESCVIQPVMDKEGGTTGLVWACSASCQWGGSKKYGEQCLSDEECCSPFCIRGECAGPCSEDADCGDGRLCERLAVPLDRSDECRVSRVPMCAVFSGSMQKCLSNAGCPADESCQYVPDRDGVPRTLCGIIPAGALAGGEQCSNPQGPCMSSFCSRAGYCVDWCEHDADCASKQGKMVCSPAELGEGAVRGACISAAGSHNPCNGDSACPAGETCRAFPAKGGARNICVAKAKGGRLPGEPCSAAAQCVNEMCLNSGACSAVCSSDADCPAAGSSVWFCGRVAIGADSHTSACLPVPGTGKACEADDDCGGGEVCSFYFRSDGTAATVCGTPGMNGAEKGGATGDACRECPDRCDASCAPLNCSSGMCLGGSQCTRVCSSNTDCPAGWVCARDPKSGLEYCIEQKALLCAPCKGDGDCLGTDENFCAKLPGGSAACASGCNPKLINSCPPGYKCAPAASVSTTAAHDACVPEALSCPAKEVVPSAPPAGTVRIPSTLKTAAGRD